MNTNELEARLEGRSETQQLDFKGPCSWDVNTFAKDILAMSNVQYGGEIIVGVDDGTWKRVGITPAQRDSFAADIMRDQMTRFADPHVQFGVELVVDRNGLEYVIIRVRQFAEVPVISRVDSEPAGVRAGAIYYRSLHRRPESASVANSYDMRTILDLATVAMMHRRRAVGYTVTRTVEEDLDRELGDL
jgi:predicted HTH transcriptional regulator